ncbi:hypothetical protein GGI08_003485 [Coemansia sp. S2]|nr:hypothetical protein GGI08_003485 [Coemansia sp. S2]KAJ2347603.1 hypothetical protein GGH92_003136 [Coemansia sp. RSA 2673]
MDPHYTMSPRPMVTYATSPNIQSSQDNRPETTTAVRRNTQPADTPQRRGSIHRDRVYRPELRSSGIGGPVQFYRKSGIGLNVTDIRDSGIGKICVEYEREDGSSGPLTSSVRRLSASITRRMSFSNSGSESNRRPSQELRRSNDLH